MRIVLLGAPGSGKGTQAELLLERLDLTHISTGALLRNAVKAGSELGLRARVVLEKGDLVSDRVMLGLIEERLCKDDVANGFILDGYPRNLAQARSLESLLERLGRPIDLAIQIDVDSELVIHRIAKRAKEEERSDDTEKTLRNRMQVYQKQTAPVADFYAKRGLLTRVMGDGDKHEVLQRILSVINLDCDSDSPPD